MSQSPLAPENPACAHEVEDGIAFTSGTSIYVNKGIVGIDEEDKLYGGYDHGIDWPATEWNRSQLTVDDMRELADFMIARWTKFKNSL